MAQTMLKSLAKASAAIGVGGFVVTECIYDVDGGQRGVIFNRFSTPMAEKGIDKDVKPEGTHFVIPWFQKAHVIDIRATPRVISSTTGTKDLQMVNISLRVLARPEEEKVPEIFQQLGASFHERVLPSIGNEVLKSVVAQYDADQLLTLRGKVSREINEEMNTRAREFNLLLDDVSITHLTFGNEFTKAIEAKQVAQQNSERAKFVVLKAEQERQAKVIEAEGEAKAAELISEATKANGTGLIEMRRIDAARDIAATLARSRNVSYIPSGGGGSGGGGSSLLLNLGA